MDSVKIKEADKWDLVNRTEFTDGSDTLFVSQMSNKTKEEKSSFLR